jgi:Zn-dependent protease with chaperone function
MIRLLIIAMLGGVLYMWASTSHAAVSRKDTQVIFNKLVQADPYLILKRPELIIEKHRELNAEAQDNKVHVSTSLLPILDKDELAGVIAHELGHVKSGEGSGNIVVEQAFQKNPRLFERRADIYGQVLMGKAGYDKCKANGFLKKLLKIHGVHGVQESPTHPPILERIRYLTCH